MSLRGGLDLVMGLGHPRTHILRCFTMCAYPASVKLKGKKEGVGAGVTLLSTYYVPSTTGSLWHPVAHFP